MSAALTQNRVLVLNKNWVAIGTVTLQRAIVMLFSEYADGTPKAKIIEPESYQQMTWADWSKLKANVDDEIIRTANMSVRIPEIILLSKYEKLPRPKLHFSRRALYKRDNYTCFTPDTMILMSDLSLKPISNVIVGDEVLDAFGHSQKVEYVHVRKAKQGEMISILRQGNGDYLTCTLDHKLLNFDLNGIMNENGIPASDIRVGSFLGEIRPSLQENDNKIDLARIAVVHDFKYASNEDDYLKHYCGNRFKRFILVDHQLGKLFGYYLAKGNLNKNVTTFSLSLNELEIAEDIFNLIHDIFGIKSILTTDDNRVILTCFSNLVGATIEKYCGSNNEKRLNLKNSKNFIQGVIYGIFQLSANLNHDIETISLNMSNINLTRDIYLASISIGLNPCLSKNTIQNGDISKYIVFNKEEYNKIFKLNKSDNNSEDFDRIAYEKYIVSKVIEVRSVDYVGDVYDLQVSGSHTYIANFVCVHNCQYCYKKFNTDCLSIDHVVPRSHGGQTNWENCVLACVDCNSRKANRTPKQAGMKLLTNPVKPKINLLHLDMVKPIKSWQAFLGECYWSVELENDI